MTSKTILVADDEPHMRRLLQFALVKIGARLEFAASGTEALEKLRAAPIDLLIIDVMMSGLDGFATVREMRQDERFRQLPVIMITSRGQTDLRAVAAELGVNVFLTKPFSPIELVQNARQLLGL